MNPPNKSYEIVLGPKVKVMSDTKSKTRVINFPFEFPDGTKGILIVIRVKDEAWIPNSDIDNVKISFK